MVRHQPLLLLEDVRLAVSFDSIGVLFRLRKSIFNCNISAHVYYSIPNTYIPQI
jgi:hypothetical protein